MPLNGDPLYHLADTIQLSFNNTVTLVISCSSPLEDVEISDFELLRVTYYADFILSDTGVVEDRLQVMVEDKNHHNFEIKGGKVTVNDMKMDYDNASTRRSYFLNDQAVKPGTEYRFIIELADGDKSESIITSANAITNVNTPGIYDPLKPYTISWDKIEGERVIITYELGDGPVNRDTISDIGTYTVSAQAPNVKSIRMKLIRSGSSTISGKLLHGSALKGYELRINRTTR